MILLSSEKNKFAGKETQFLATGTASILKWRKGL